MRKTVKVALREYKATVRTKGFIIGLVLAPVLMGGSAIGMALFKDRVDTRDKTVAVVDRSGLLAEVLMRAATTRNDQAVFDEESGEKVQPAYTIEVVEPSGTARETQLLQLSDRVRSNDLHAVLEIGEGGLRPRERRGSSGISY